jgi:hypothetical protein
MPAKLKVAFFKQDWISHAINFIGIFVSVLLGFLVANHTDANRDAELVEKLLGDYQTGSFVVLKQVEGTEIYFSESRQAATQALDNWKTSSSKEFVFNLFKASQITTPPHELNFYSSAFQTDGLLKIRNQNVRQQAAKFFSYDTDVFKLEALTSSYRSHIRSVLPHDYQTNFRLQCADTLDANLGTQHAANCFEKMPSVSDELASKLRDNTRLKQDLTNYISQLLIMEQSLKNYRCNIIIFANSISSEIEKQHNIPSFCSS